MNNEIKELISLIDKEIETHEKALAQLRKMRGIWSKYQPPKVQVIDSNKPLTRDLVRLFLKGYKQPIQTTEIIQILYSSRNDEDRYNLTKHLSVMLNQMAKSGELIAESKAGVKGNFYTISE